MRRVAKRDNYEAELAMVMRWINNPDAVSEERRAVYGPRAVAGWVAWGGFLLLLGAGLFWVGLSLGTDTHSIEMYLGALRRSGRTPDGIAGIGVGQWGVALTVVGAVLLLIGLVKTVMKIDELLNSLDDRSEGPGTSA